MLEMRKYLVVVAISLLIFATIVEDVTEKEFWINIDANVNSWATTVQNSQFMLFAEFLNLIFEPAIVTFILLIMAVFLWFRDSKGDSLFFLILMLLSFTSIELVKLVMHKARPPNMLIIVSGYSFPSGHATMSVVLFGLIIYLILKHIKNRYYKLIMTSISSVMILLIGYSRIYLNVHWFSDVIGGYALGMFLLSGGLIFLNISKRGGYINTLPIHNDKDERNSASC
jgi:undecaprenyl-diphosphatase